MVGPFESSPIAQVELVGQVLPLQGLIVLVGANSSGKTSLLRDVHVAACRMERRLVVAQKITYRTPPPFDNFIKQFTATGDMELAPPAGEIEQRQKRGPQLGPHGGAGAIERTPNLHQQHGAFAQFITVQPVGPSMPAVPFLQWFGGFECSALFIEQRLTITMAAGSFDTHQAVPGRHGAREGCRTFTLISERGSGSDNGALCRLKPKEAPLGRAVCAAQVEALIQRASRLL
jgi:hypothetical protein